MTAEIDCPVIILTSGQSLKLRQVMMFDARAVAEIASLRSAAAKVLGPSGMSYGVIGTPNLAFAAEVAALSLVSGFLANVAQSQAIKNLKTASDRFESLQQEGIFFPVDRVKNLYSPTPSSWLVEGDLQDQEVNVGSWSRGDRDEFLVKHGKNKHDIIDNKVLVKLPGQYIHHGDDFVTVMTDIGRMSVRWSDVTAYFPRQDANGKLVFTRSNIESREP